MPDDMPVTNPVGLTVQTNGAMLLQAPPGAASVNAVLEPIQTKEMPEMEPAADSELTVTNCVAAAVPQLLITV